MLDMQTKKEKDRLGEGKERAKQAIFLWNDERQDDNKGQG